MRPVLIELPSRFLFVVAIVWAIGSFVLDVAGGAATPNRPAARRR